MASLARRSVLAVDLEDYLAELFAFFHPGERVGAIGERKT